MTNPIIHDSDAVIVDAVVGQMGAAQGSEGAL
jgi:hypothetical protein